MIKTFFNTKAFDSLIAAHALAVTSDPAEADIAVLGAKPIDLPTFTQLKALYRFGVGAENIDFDAMKLRGIPVHFPSDRAKDILFDGTANFTVHGILSMLYHGAFGDIEAWTKDQHAHLAHQRAVVIGTGNVGGRVAKKLAVFMPVETFDILTNKPEELPMLIRAADVITVHMPLTDETKNFFDTEKLSWMKESALIVNTARGGLFNEEALYEKLTHSDCRAFFDVFWQEPYNGKLKSLGKEKFFMTPHSASNTKAFIEAGFQDILELVRAVEARQ